MDAWITKNGITYDYYKIIKDNKANVYEDNQAKNDDVRKGHIVRNTLKNSSKQVVVETKQKSIAYHNYILCGKENWVDRVELFEEVTIKNLYDGIHKRYYFDNGLIRYDFIVEPGADYSQIKM